MVHQAPRGGGKRLSVAQRHGMIKDIARSVGGVPIPFLAEYFQVSARTILGDIIAMPELWHVVKVGNIPVEAGK